MYRLQIIRVLFIRKLNANRSCVSVLERTQQFNSKRWARATQLTRVYVLCVRSQLRGLNRTYRDTLANFHPQTAFSVNNLLSTKILKLTKTLENNKVKNLTNIS
jgi:hypothetical protein